MIYATLDRFGYDLTIICETEKEAIDKLMKEYRRAFKKSNGCAPTKKETDWAKECIEIQEFEIGKVEWR